MGSLDRGPFMNIGSITCQLGAHSQQIATAAITDENDAVPFVNASRRQKPSRGFSQEDGQAGSLQEQRDDGSVVS